MTDDSIEADAMAVAQEFRSANDEDNLLVLRIQSSKKQSDLDKLFFYVVPASWMRKAWPYLSGVRVASAKDEWKESIGRIELADLLVRDHEISDEEEEERTQQQQQKSRVLHELQQPKRSFSKQNQHQQLNQSKILVHKKPTLRRDLHHAKDFFLMGPSAWHVVKQKFGYDFEVKQKCTFVEQPDGTSLGVILSEDDVAAGRCAVHQAIPPTGRFGYESLLDAPVPQQAASDDLPHPGNVSDDDETDLFPMLDDGDHDLHGPAEQASSDERVLLLPPSSPVAASAGETYGWKRSDEDDDNREAVVETRAVMRRYGSGLGNLGNTCFMNSTLQCLAHTDPLRKYFLSGNYEKDLNYDNPLGTGGELASQFAQLMAEMWRTGATNGTRGVYNSSTYSSHDPQSTSNVVYPRSFKYTLGKHAEQFMGYDQHDSQELATYLLDALHEDTNRVTNKPYIEKPEQAEDESDEEAARKAWELHLKRENSYIMENFMAQVKSRVQCCEPQCGRVSTTFDPIMFLSVPIPGSSERSITVTFVPLNPKERPKSFSVTVNKVATIAELLKKVEEKITKSNLTGLGYAVSVEDMAACDLWQHEIHSWHNLSKEVGTIRENDETVIYELEPLSKIRKIEEKIAREAVEQVDESVLGLRKAPSRQRRYKLDIGEMTRLNAADQWIDELRKYVKTHHSLYDLKKTSTQERIAFLNKLTTFVDSCFREVEDIAGQKRGRDTDSVEILSESVSPKDPPLRAIEDRTDGQNLFENVKSIYDLTVLDFISRKLRAEVLQIEQEKKAQYPDGVTLEVRMRKTSSGNYSARDQRLAAPLVLRIPSNMTVYGLREEIARRMARSLKGPSSSVSAGQRTKEEDVLPIAARMNGGVDSAFGSPALLCLRQIPLSYLRRSSSIRTNSTGRQLGSNLASYTFDGTKPVSLASPKDEDERVFVAELVGDHGTVILEWPEELAEQYFDGKEFSCVDDIDALEDVGKKKGSSVITVLDCIDKFCQMEQLEETEMWYCNRCKQHVRAWKQFHIYRSPPILLIHLKRFHYSARSHRRDKISLFIDFPLKNLDLTQHVLSWTEEEKPIYDCYAVSNHYGGLGGGHYTAYAVNDDGTWCYYDDSRITTDIDPKEVVSDAAYVLYYRRRDVPVGEDFVMNLQTPGMAAPALIQVERGRDHESSEVSSSAAMVGDDMDIDDADDVVSQETSPMASVADTDEHLGIDGDLDADDDENAEHGTEYPLQ